MTDLVSDSASFREATVEKVPSNSNDIANKAYVDSVSAADLENVASHIIPQIDETYDLGSQEKKWDNIWAAVAVLTTMLVIGGVALTWDAVEERLIINDSLYVNGTIEANGTITAQSFIGDGSALTGISTSNGTYDLNITTDTGSGLIEDDEILIFTATGGAGVTMDGNTVTINSIFLSQENVEDYVGGMVTGNTETGITVTYEDGDGTLDFVVDTLTDNDHRDAINNTPGIMNFDQVNITNNMTFGNHSISYNSTTLSIRVT